MWIDTPSEFGLSTDRQIDAFQPMALQLELFLKPIAARGPTAAPSVMSGLLWLRKHCGLHKLPMDNHLLRRFVVPPPGYATVQKAALPIETFRALVSSASPLDSTFSIISAVLLRALVSGLRHAHMCRAVTKRESWRSHMQVFFITKGKTRNRAGFHISIPTYVSANNPIFTNLDDVLCRKLGENASNNVFIPDVSIGPTRLMQGGDLVPQNMWRCLIKYCYEY